ncbi:MAG: GDSL-type esterase/lipase family protein [Edaphobacter sp.]|uniref:GDSL-type esterase/lipase family protein n=1 Tax=Edaphobacter sp. TaxID=1934404 RepID=UPI00238870FB|nr:GDSL-type esterase/lipase family protein [Edaphobacter sp.]MDE1175912.1 GDSL-type esterase/lipase family protein [Edaphobacter sp.]
MIRLLLATLLLLPLPLAAQQPTMQQLLPAIAPRPRLDEPWWAERHQHILDQLARRPDIRLLLIGDSITQNYEKSNPPDENFLPTWNQFYAPRHALNLGFSGDSTANVLWRLTHGEIDNIKPSVAILLIGTNNTGHEHQTAEQTIAGIDNIIGTLAQRLPQTRILLLGILPSDVSPEKTAADKAINAYLAKRYGHTPSATTSTTAELSSRPKAHSAAVERPASPPPNTPSQQPTPSPHDQAESRITYLDLTPTFLKPDGALDTAIFYDPRLPHPGKALHPDTNAQHKMAEAIEPTLSNLLNDTPRTRPH